MQLAFLFVLSLAGVASGEPPWVPRRAIYRGNESMPSFDSFHTERCRQSGSKQWCPPILMTLGLGHAGTTTMNSWLVGKKARQARGNRTQGDEPIFEISESSIGKETKFFDTWRPRTWSDVARNYLPLFEVSSEPLSRSPQERGHRVFRRAIDITPGIGRCPRRTVVDSIYNSFPRMKFLVFLRDPVDWLYSASYCANAKSFDAWARKHIGGPNGFPLATCFASTISTFFLKFERSRFLFIPSNVMKLHPEEVLLDVFDFIGLEALIKHGGNTSFDLSASWSTLNGAEKLSDGKVMHLGISSLHKEEINNETRFYLNERTCHCTQELHTLLDLKKPLYGALPCPEESPAAHKQRRIALKTSCTDWRTCQSQASMIQVLKGANVRSNPSKSAIFTSLMQKRPQAHLSTKDAVSVPPPSLPNLGIATVAIGNTSVTVLKDNQVYRVGDILLKHGGRWLRDSVAIRKDPEFNSTLLRKYLERCESAYFRKVKGRHQGRVVVPPSANVTTREMALEYEHDPAYQADYTLVRELCTDVLERAGSKLEPPTTLVAYLRAGDRPLGELKGKNAGGAHLATLEEDIRWELSREDMPKISRLVVVVVLHYAPKFGTNKEKPEHYFWSESGQNANLQALAQFLGRLPLPYTIRSQPDPDLDFCYLAMAPRFVAMNYSHFALCIQRARNAGSHCTFESNGEATTVIGRAAVVCSPISKQRQKQQRCDSAPT